MFNQVPEPTDLMGMQVQQIMQQANAIGKMYNEFVTAKREIDVTKTQMLQIETRTNERLEKIENSQSLLHGEAKRLDRKIKDKAHKLAVDFFENEVSRKLFLAKRMHLSIGLRKKLNEYFDAISYTTIRHIDFDKAMNFIDQYKLTDMPGHYLTLTDRQKEIAQENNDIVTNFYERKDNTLDI